MELQIGTLVEFIEGPYKGRRAVVVGIFDYCIQVALEYVDGGDAAFIIIRLSEILKIKKI